MVALLCFNCCGKSVRGPESGVGQSTKDQDNNINGHAYVDLGLSVNWAACNVGANTSTEYGDYFAWGEVKQKRDYRWETYKWSKGTYNTQTKYCMSNVDGTVDQCKKLDMSDDVATANWGADWRMPTMEEVKELLDGCEWEWQTDYNGTGVAGRVGISKKNGKLIFLPAAGYRSDTDFYVQGEHGLYWSASLSDYSSGTAYNFEFNSIDIGRNGSRRFLGQSVRAVVASR